MISDHYTNNQSFSIIYLLFVLLLSPAITLTGAQPSPDGRNDQTKYARFTPSVGIIIAVLVAALFLMGFFSIYIGRNSNLSATNTVRSVTEAITGRDRRGLDPEVIDTFPTFVYSTVKGLKIGKGALECAVCLNEFEDDETLRLIPKCDHVFHPECIDAWLESHTTCPVCRANLVPQLGEPLPDLPAVADIEDQNDAVEPVVEESYTDEQQFQVQVQEPELLDTKKTLNRNRTRGSMSNRMRRLFPRSHTTGHSLIQPGENTDRFTLRLPAEVRKQVMNRHLNRATSMVIFPGEGSSRLGYRNTGGGGGGDGGSRGKFSRRFEKLDRATKSDRWVFNRMPSFLTRMSSVKSPRVVANDGAETSTQPIALGIERSDSVRPPV